VDILPVEQKETNRATHRASRHLRPADLLMPAPGDEGRHPAGPEPLWGESWYFDFAAPDASLGGYVRLGLYPRLGTAWFWAYLVGDDRPLIAVRDHEVSPPRGAQLEVRSEGLWSALTCETALDHWSVGLEAFAVALDSPVDAYQGERGDRVGLGFDLEWEATSPAFDYRAVTRYEQSCRVHGEVLVGAEKLTFDGTGQRDHSWGVRDWWSYPWSWTAGALSDDTSFHGVQAGWPGTTFETGYLAAGDDVTEVDRLTVDTVLGDHGLPVSAKTMAGELTLSVTPTALAPVLLESQDGRVARLPRALCQYRTADGRTGAGWTEWLQQA
jgi:hypothetical protein